MFYNFTKIKIKNFECPKSIRNYEKKIMLGTSDTWSTSHSSRRTSELAYYIVDCRISRQAKGMNGLSGSAEDESLR